MKALITRLLIVACVIVFLGQSVNPELSQSLALYPDSLTRDPARLVTSMFAHSNFVHLGMNMLALWVVGSQLEVKLGGLKFVLVYFASGLLGSLVYLLSMPELPAVGASGAIFGLLGIALPYTRYNSQVVLLVALNMFIGFTVPNIAWEAHLGGLIAGFLLGYYWFQWPEKKLSREF